MRHLILITGGIGAGKSVVCNILRTMGHDVFDCDSHARAIMDNSDEIKCIIAESVSADAVDSFGTIDRKALARAVFSDQKKLDILNSAVHSAVREQIISGIESSYSREPFFVETAIPYASGLDALADEIWEVTAPEAVRIKRVMERNGWSYDEIKSRIDAQTAEISRPGHILIINDGIVPVLPRIEQLLTEASRQTV